MTSQLQRRFSNNITMLCRRLLIDVFFTTLLQRRDMVERRRDLKTTTLQRRHNVVCPLGKEASIQFQKSPSKNISTVSFFFYCHPTKITRAKFFLVLPKQIKQVLQASQFATVIFLLANIFFNLMFYPFLSFFDN